MTRSSLPLFFPWILAATLLFSEVETLSAHYKTRQSEWIKAEKAYRDYYETVKPDETTQADKAHQGLNSYKSERTNFLGIIDVRPKSFAIPKPTTVRVRRSEWAQRSNYTGREVRLLWGLITFTDY